MARTGPRDPVTRNSGEDCRRRDLGSFHVSDSMIRATWPAQVVRRLRGGQGHRRRGPARRGVRLPRAQRRRQVLDHADDRRGVPGQRRRAGDPRHGSRRRRSRDPRPAGGLPAGGHPRQRAQRPRQPVHLRPLLRDPAGRGQQPRRRAARVRPAHREGEVHRRGPLRRHEAPAHDRPQPDQPARPAAPRRADHRPGPPGPPRALGPAVPAQAVRRDAGDHHPLHGRGRAAVRPAGGDGQGADRRRGQPARPDPPALHARGGRAPVRRRRGGHDPRGAGREGRRPRRPRRGAARPAAGLQRRRRGGHRQGPRARPASRWRCSSAAPRWRTSSSGSPAGRWWTDGHDHHSEDEPHAAGPRPRPRRRRRPPGRLLVDGLPPHLARHRHLLVRHPGLLRPGDGGAPRRLHRGRPGPARGRDVVPRLRRPRPGRRPRDADRRWGRPPGR